MLDWSFQSFKNSKRRYHDCNDISEDKEMNHAWEYFNEIIYDEINNYYGSGTF